MKRKIILIGLLAIFLLISISSLPVTSINVGRNLTDKFSQKIVMDIPEINVKDAKKLIDSYQDVIVIDVRSFEEYNYDHIKDALSIPFIDLSCESCLQEIVEKSRNKIIIVYSEFSQRSRIACEILTNYGIKNFFALIGGFQAWKKAGYPTQQYHSYYYDESTPISHLLSSALNMNYQRNQVNIIMKKNPSDYDYFELSTINDWDYFCKHDDVTKRNMESWICDNPEGGPSHNPCWCHLGIQTYFIGKDGIYEFSHIEGETGHTEICGCGNPPDEDMWICKKYDIWPVDGEPLDPYSWRWYLESSIDGIHWELVSKYPFDKIKHKTPFGPSDFSPSRFRFLRFRMPLDRKGIGLGGYMDSTRFIINESQVEQIDEEGLHITRIQGVVKTHKYRWMEVSSMLVQLSYNGTNDWNIIQEFNITNDEPTSFDVILNNTTHARFVRLLPQADMWNGMPATPAFIDFSNITITHIKGVEELSCEEHTMESGLSPLHPCWSGGEGCEEGDKYNCINYFMSGSFHHTYPLLQSKIVSNPPDQPSKPDGATSGSAGIEYTYSTFTIDLDGDLIYYMFDWNASGSHNLTPWIGPYNSGEITGVNHSWNEKGTYDIRVIAKDNYGFQSEWSDPLTVTMPKNKPFIFNLNLIEWLLEHYSNIFPILRQLL